jgi:hypothetical protein
MEKIMNMSKAVSRLALIFLAVAAFALNGCTVIQEESFYSLETFPSA